MSRRLSRQGTLPSFGAMSTMPEFSPQALAGSGRFGSTGEIHSVKYWRIRHQRETGFPLLARFGSTRCFSPGLAGSRGTIPILSPGAAA